MTGDIWTVGIDPAPRIEGAEAKMHRAFCPAATIGYLCTRPLGHPGRHMAGIGGDRINAAWPGTGRPTAADLEAVPS